MLLPLAIAVALSAAPQLESTADLPPGPDGNVAAQGKLKKRFCFDEPAVCVPAGSEVLLTTNGLAKKQRWSLSWVTPSKPLTLYGLTFVGGEKLQFPGSELVGTLAEPARIGPWQVIGAVRVTVKSGKPDQLQRGTLAAPGDVGEFALPTGCTFEPGDAVMSFECPAPLRGVRRGEGWPQSARALRTSLRFFEGADNTVGFSDAEPPLADVPPLTSAAAVFPGAPTPTSWRVASGALVEPLAAGRVRAATGAAVTWCRDGVAAIAPAQVDGVAVAAMERVKRESAYAASWAARCVQGDIWRGSASCTNAQGLPATVPFEFAVDGGATRRVCP